MLISVDDDHLALGDVLNLSLMLLNTVKCARMLIKLKENGLKINIKMSFLCLDLFMVF